VWIRGLAEFSECVHSVACTQNQDKKGQEEEGKRLEFSKYQISVQRHLSPVKFQRGNPHYQEKFLSILEEKKKDSNN
jgi:hypothetical protein